MIWIEKDEIQITQNSTEILNKFVVYRENVLNKLISNDVAQLLTSQIFVNRIKGKAESNAICEKFCAGVVNDDGISNKKTAIIMAHEIGHNLGLVHDKMECDCKYCIMATELTVSSKLEWSNCSRVDSRNFDLNGKFDCLK